MEFITLIIEFLAIAVGVGLFVLDRRARRAEAEEDRGHAASPAAADRGDAP